MRSLSLVTFNYYPMPNNSSCSNSNNRQIKTKLYNNQCANIFIRLNFPLILTEFRFLFEFENQRCGRAVIFAAAVVFVLSKISFIQALLFGLKT